MKPDKKTCLYCGKEITGKKMYCSDAHRMAYKRQVEQQPEHEQQETEQSVPEQPKSNTFRDTLTKTDKTFYDRAMRDFNEPYYNFEGSGYKDHKMREGNCKQCGAGFKTMLALNQYCSYQHYSDAIRGKL